MNINREGLELIKTFEGLALEAYVDPVGIWTIGYGHIEGVRPGQRITEAEAEEILMEDLQTYENGVERLVRVPLNENEFSALVSFAFNVGVAALGRSTALKRLNRGDRLGAADALTWWNKGRVGGQLTVLPGLTRRRAAERALFMKPVAGELPAPAPPETIEESGRVRPTEERPDRRENLAQSRTIQGAGAGGAAGAAATAGAVAEMVMDDEDAEKVPEIAEEPVERLPEVEDGEPIEEAGEEPTETPSEEPMEAPVEVAEEAPVPVEPVEPAAPAEPPEPEGGFSETVDAVGQFFRDNPEIYVILGVIILFAITYIIFARIDDWRNGRR